jgi:hypothetical protein
VSLQLLIHSAGSCFYHTVKINPYSHRNYQFSVQPIHRPIDLSFVSVSRVPGSYVDVLKATTKHNWSLSHRHMSWTIIWYEGCLYNVWHFNFLQCSITKPEIGLSYVGVSCKAFYRYWIDSVICSIILLKIYIMSFRSAEMLFINRPQRTPFIILMYCIMGHNVYSLVRQGFCKRIWV